LTPEGSPEPKGLKPATPMSPMAAWGVNGRQPGPMNATQNILATTRPVPNPLPVPKMGGKGEY